MWIRDRIKDEFDKKVDILVNNAGITNDKLMMRMSDEDFTKVIDANINGTFYMMKELSALMVKKKNGVIINMASVSGLKEMCIRDRLSATVEPNSATDGSVTWISRNSEAVTVDENGNITAQAEGATVIAAIVGASERCV